MFRAVNENFDDVVACDLDKNNKEIYLCPNCAAEVILKKGRIKIPHFAHKIKEGCEYGEGESIEHLEVKMWLYNYFKSNGIEAEPECTRWKNMRPDLAAKINNKWIGFEIQKSAISLDEIEKRNAKYLENDIPVLWILPNNFYKNFRQKEFRLSEQNRYLKGMYFGNLFVFNDNKLFKIQCDNAEHWHEGGYDSSGNEHSGYYFTCKTIFYKTLEKEVDLLNDFQEIRKNKYRHYPESLIYSLKYGK